MENIDKSVVVYKSSDGLVSFDVSVDAKEITVWLTQAQMAELFERDRKTITRHIINIFKEQELDQTSVCSFFEHTAKDGKKYSVQYYNLDVIISVGYRVKSKRGTEFRQWATKILKDYLINGYATNTRKLKEIEENLKIVITRTNTHDKNYQKLIVDMDFIKKMLTPKNIVVQNYLDIQIKTKTAPYKNELIQQLTAIKAMASEANIKKLIEEQLANLKNVDQKTAQTGLTKFIKALDTSNSKLAKSLTDAGVTLPTLKKLIKLGWALLKNITR